MMAMALPGLGQMAFEGWNYELGVLLSGMHVLFNPEYMKKKIKEFQNHEVETFDSELDMKHYFQITHTLVFFKLNYILCFNYLEISINNFKIIFLSCELPLYMI